MISTKTLFSYLFRTYCNYFLFISFLLSSILLLSNIFDNLQRFKAVHIPTQVFWSMVFYKLPYLMAEISPLIGFISMLFFLRKLTSHNELIIIFCNGISVWKVVSAPILASFLFGAFITWIISPIGAYGLNKYEIVEAELLKKKQNEVLISATGILLFGEYEDNNYIIKAKSINLKTAELKEIVCLFINQNNKFIKRIDARRALLKNNKFELLEATEHTDKATNKFRSLIINTNLRIEDFANKFILPEKTSIWELSKSIRRMMSLGLPTLNHQIYYYKQISKPLLMCANVILAACFFSVNLRNNSQNKIFVGGILVGFIIYSIIEVLAKLLVFGGIAPVISISLPISLLIFISSFIILNIHT